MKKMMLSIVVLIVVDSVLPQTAVDFSSSNLPIVIIDTRGRVIEDAHKIDADMRIIDNGVGRRNLVTDQSFTYNGIIGIETRGSSTLQFPKKQFAIETRDAAGAGLNVSLLGLPEENDWILDAPFSDKTLMRNVLAYRLSNDLGHYASRTRYCELILNGNYWGVYVLMEKIKRDKNRVAVAKLDSADVTAPKITGGYILKVDKPAGENVGGWRSEMPLFLAGATGPSPFYQFHYPKPDQIRPEQAAYIKGFITDFEKMMAGPEYDDPAGGMWTALDMGSVMDFVIINELSKNVDGYRLSSFLYKDRDDRDPRLHLGPVWDFNIAFGNADYNMEHVVHGWQIEYFLTNERFNKGGDRYMIPFWWGKIWYSPRFQNKLYQRWRQLRRTALDLDRLLDFIDATARQLDEAQQRNFTAWPILGQYVWPNDFAVGSTYQDEVNTLKQWLRERIEWMDEHLRFDPAEVAKDHEAIGDFRLGANYPNPFNASTAIPLFLDRPGEWTVEVYNLLGKPIATLHRGMLPAGETRLRWHGLEEGGKAAPTGVYYVRAAGAFTDMIKIILMR